MNTRLYSVPRKNKLHVFSYFIAHLPPFSSVPLRSSILMFVAWPVRRKRLPRCRAVRNKENKASLPLPASVECVEPVTSLVGPSVVSSAPDSPKLSSYNSNIMPEPLSDTGSHFYSDKQKNLWKELIQAIKISKELSVVYDSSAKDQKSDSKELWNAFKKSNVKTQVALETLLNSFIAQAYDDGHNNSSDIETRPNQTQVSSGIPRYRSRSRSPDSEGKIRPNTKIQFPSKTEFRSQSRNLNRSPSRSRILRQSRNVYRSSSDSPNQTRYEGRNKSRSKSRESDTRSMYSSVTRHRPRSRNLNRSPSNYRTRTQHGRRNRSRSRSHNKQYDPRRKYSSKNRQRSQSRIREKSKSKSLDRKYNKNYYPSSSSENYKFKNRQEHHDEHSPQNKFQQPFKKWKKYKSTQSTEELPIPVVNTGSTAIPPPQGVCQAPFYPQNVTPVYYAQPTHMPRFMPHSYYMPPAPRPRLQYPPTYPTMLYRPHWQPAVFNFDAQ